MKIKNHMKNKGKRVQQRMQKTFGIDTNFLIKCCQGDEDSLRTLGQMGREGALISKLMPKVQAAALSTIKGTEDLNVGIAQIIKQAATSSTAIDRASSDVMLANQRYINDRKELAATFATSKEAESIRHSHAIDYIKLNAYIDRHMMQVDANVRLLEATNKPELRQIDADIARKDKVADHLLKYGDASEVELIPEKNYVRSGFGETLAKLKQAILGF
ncbi:MAG: hypothetical protein RMY28_036175 [Nostoc sp. ChiSLP01]|nr:hypothetical protein [Nostoc sp. CmiSLP01]MDZ8282556.1 hypothetical protein [Nostoc sp. ChiSLP01]